MSDSYNEWRLPDASWVRCAWAADSSTGGSWTQPATEFWGLGFGLANGVRSAELVGPMSAPRELQVPPDSSWWGVELHAAAFFRGVTKDSVTTFEALPVVGERFELGGVSFPWTDRQSLSRLVQLLVSSGVLVADPDIAKALDGFSLRGNGSARSARRRTQSVVGLNKQQVHSIRRARKAFALLSEGWTAIEVVAELGFADQPHLTRSLRSLAGRTPREILTAGQNNGHIVQDLE